MAVFIGALALAILFAGGAFGAWRLRTLPIRWACPECHHATTPVLRPGMSRLRRRIQWRWCPRCHWGGWSRPRRVKVRTQSLASVLREAVQGTLPSAGSFQWAPPSDPPPAPRFRWAHEVTGDGNRRTGDGASHGAGAMSAHPSGFRWAEDDARASTGKADADHPSGFQWADPPSSPGAPVFQWKETEPATLHPPAPLRWLASALTRDASGFKWGAPARHEPRSDGPAGDDPDFFGWQDGGDAEGDTFGFHWKE